MSAIQLPTDLSDRYELLARELDGFDDADRLVRYVLEATAAELERSEVAETGNADSAADDVVAERLERLGYLEK